MTVIIPHPTQLLQFVKFQKKLISLMNKDGTVFYCHHNLWIELNNSFFDANNKQSLKNLSQTIKSVSLSSPVFEKNEIYLPGQLIAQDNIVNIKLPLLHLYKKNGSKELQSLLPSIPVIPAVTLRIFRLGIKEDLSKNSQSITDYVWVKL